MANQKRDIPTLNNANYLKVLQKNGLSEDQFWSSALQKMIVLEQDQFVFTKLAKKERIPKNAGTKVWTTRRYLSLPVDLEKGKLAEGVAPQPMTVEGKTVSGTVNQYGTYIELTDVANDIHFDDIFNIYHPELARHAAETIEKDLIAAVEAEASVAFTGSATSTATVTEKIKFSDLRRAWLTMKNHRRRGHSLAGGKPIFVCHPNVMQDLLDDTDVIAELIIVPGYDEKIIKTGSINQYTVYGVYLMETQVLEPLTVSGKNIYRSFLVGHDAFALLALGSSDVKWYRKGFVADSNDPLGQKSTLGYKLWTGGKVLDPIAVKVIYSASGFDAVLADWTKDVDGRTANQGLATGATLTVAKAPNKTTYAVGDTFESEGLIVSAIDSYGYNVIIDNANLTFAPMNIASGTNKVVATYVEGANTFTVDIPVTVA